MTNREQRARDALNAEARADGFHGAEKRFHAKDVGMIVRAMLAFSDAERSAQSEPGDGQSAIDQAHALGMDEGVDFVVNYLAEVLGVPNWTVCDGSEEWEGDVRATVFNVLVEAKVISDEDHSIARHSATPAPQSAPASDGLREALAAAWMKRRGTTVVGRDGWDDPHIRISFNKLEHAHAFDEALRAALTSAPQRDDLVEALRSADAFGVGPNGRGGSKITLDFEDIEVAHRAFAVLSDAHNSALSQPSAPSQGEEREG